MKHLAIIVLGLLCISFVTSRKQPVVKVLNWNVEFILNEDQLNEVDLGNGDRLEVMCEGRKLRIKEFRFGGLYREGCAVRLSKQQRNYFQLIDPESGCVNNIGIREVTVYVRDGIWNRYENDTIHQMVWDKGIVIKGV